MVAEAWGLLACILKDQEIPRENAGARLPFSFFPFVGTSAYRMTPLTFRLVPPPVPDMPKCLSYHTLSFYLSRKNGMNRHPLHNINRFPRLHSTPPPSGVITQVTYCYLKTLLDWSLSLIFNMLFRFWVSKSFVLCFCFLFFFQLKPSSLVDTIFYWQ